jgi:DNA-binding transcriptional LysR family regulator
MQFEMNWEDLRYILAVARHGTISEGAKVLKVNATTVSRRLRAMEEEAGAALFDKLKHGAVLTPAGEEMVAVAETVERLTNELDARITGLDTKLEGPIRVTSTDSMLAHWLDDFGSFCRKYPDIELELTSGFQLANLTQREADVAVRVARQAPEHLIGRKHAEMMFAVYGCHELVESMGEGAGYPAFPWVAWDASPGRDAWLLRHAPDPNIAMRVGHMRLMVDALEKGFGLSVLPCFVGDSNPKLRRVGAHLEGGMHIWVLTHPQLRGAARIRAFTTLMRELIERDKDLIEGRRPQ